MPFRNHTHPLAGLTILMLLLTTFACHLPATRTVYRDSILPKDLRGETPAIVDRHQLTISERRVRLTKTYLAQHNQTLHNQLPEGNHPQAIGFDPQIVVVHYTVIPTLEEVLTFFAPETLASTRDDIRDSGSLNVGVQFIIDRDGTIYRFYPETIMARHVIGLNHVAIGIENIGNADFGTSKKGELPLTAAQLEANISLIRHLAGKHRNLRYLIGHSEYRDLEHVDHPAHHLFHEDIPSYRTEKTDPGKQFMKALRSRLGMP